VLQVRAAIAHCLRVLDPARLKHDDDVVDRDLVHLLGVQLGTVDIHRSPTFCDALFALHAGDVGGDGCEVLEQWGRARRRRNLLPVKLGLMPSRA
jgi:hypothetical protein